MIEPLPPPGVAFRTVVTLEQLLLRAAPGLLRGERARAGAGSPAGTVPTSLDRGDLDLGSTLRAACRRRAGGSGAPEVEHEDLRASLRERPPTLALVLVVDASASMRRAGRMSRVKALLRDSLERVRRRRWRAALVSFRHDSSELLVPSTADTAQVVAALSELALGGRTPLAAGLSLGLRAVRRERCCRPEVTPVMLVLSDGRPNLSATAGGDPFDEAVEVAAAIGRDRVPLVFVDTEDDPMSSGCGHQVAEAAGGHYTYLTDLSRRWAGLS